jgi:hypothetical protein
MKNNEWLDNEVKEINREKKISNITFLKWNNKRLFLGFMFLMAFFMLNLLTSATHIKPHKHNHKKKERTDTWTCRKCKRINYVVVSHCAICGRSRWE